VGKTSLIRRFVHFQFDEKYLSTVGTNVSSKDQEVYIPEVGATMGLKLLIWDVAGQQLFSDVDAAYFKGAKGAFVVCDVTNRASLDNLSNWINRFRDICPDAPFMVLANKSDLKGVFTIDHARKIADGHRTHSFLTSAKTGDGVENAFQTLGVAIGKAHLGMAAEIDEKVELFERVEDAPGDALNVQSGYLVLQKRPDKGFSLFNSLLRSGYKGLCVTRMFPEDVEKEYGIADSQSVKHLWLSKTEDSPIAVSPMPSKISHNLLEFIKNNDRPAVLLEGLDYLVVQSEFKQVLKVIQSVMENIYLKKGCLILSVDPGTIKEEDINLLGRDMLLLRP